jgi:hypothetical protein
VCLESRVDPATCRDNSLEGTGRRKLFSQLAEWRARRHGEQPTWSSDFQVCVLVGLQGQGRGDGLACGHGRVEANAAAKKRGSGGWRVSCGMRLPPPLSQIVHSKTQHAALNYMSSSCRLTCLLHLFGPALRGHPGCPCAHVATDIRPTAHGLDLQLLVPQCAGDRVES